MWVFALKRNQKPMPKCLETSRTADGEHLVIQNPLALCYILHMSGGERPSNFTVLGKTLCEACWHWHGRDAKGHT